MKKNYPENKMSITITDQSEDVVGFRDAKEGTLLFKGISDSFAKFSSKSIEDGCVSFHGTSLFIEFKNRRYKVSVEELVQHCIELDKENPEFKKRKRAKK